MDSLLFTFGGSMRSLGIKDQILLRGSSSGPGGQRSVCGSIGQRVSFPLLLYSGLTHFTRIFSSPV